MVLTRRAPYTYEDDERIAVDAPRTARASLHTLPGGQPRHHPITEDDEALISDLTTTRSRRRTALRNVPVSQQDDEDRVVIPIRRQHQRHTNGPVQQARHRVPISFWIVLGMAAMLVLWSIFVHVGAWYINTFHDPAYYTQTAHRDMATVTDTQGHQSQVRAFVDLHGNLDLLLIPEDAGRARMIVGVPLVGINNPQQRATLTVTTIGTVVTVSAQGPMVADWFTMYRQSAQWTTDVSQQKQQSGG